MLNNEKQFDINIVDKYENTLFKFRLENSEFSVNEFLQSLLNSIENNTLPKYNHFDYDLFKSTINENNTYYIGARSLFDLCYKFELSIIDGNNFKLL